MRATGPLPHPSLTAARLVSLVGRCVAATVAAVMLAPSAAGGLEALAHYVDGHEHEHEHEHDVAHAHATTQARHDAHAHPRVATTHERGDELAPPDVHCGVHCHAHHPPVVALAVLPSHERASLIAPVSRAPSTPRTQHVARLALAGPERPPRA
ncbi:MAG: hypothetical protein KF901_26130 [Myxococcales bacterium]|nr:hypothetical protein [Myxococcales bacterium]